VSCGFCRQLLTLIWWLAGLGESGSLKKKTKCLRTCTCDRSLYHVRVYSILRKFAPLTPQSWSPDARRGRLSTSGHRRRLVFAVSSLCCSRCWTTRMAKHSRCLLKNSSSRRFSPRRRGTRRCRLSRWIIKWSSILAKRIVIFNSSTQEQLSTQALRYGRRAFKWFATALVLI